MNESESHIPHPVTEVFSLPWIEPSAQYEAALVFYPPRDVSEAVESLRRQLDFPRQPEHQLRPHMTLLYLGKMTGERLVPLWRSMTQFRNAHVNVGLEHISVFERAGRIVNVHVRVTGSAKLFELHERALHVGTQFVWFDCGPYVGDGYVPHISILDKIDVAAASAALPKEFSFRGLRVALAQPCIITRCL
jgi:2'-5' RNA ligase